MPDQNQDHEIEQEAFNDFVSEKTAARGKQSPKQLIRDAARRNAQEASKVAAEYLAQPAPQIASQPDVVPVEATPAPTGVATCCACPTQLGHAVYGVHHEGKWYCPEHFMRMARSHELHPSAHAVDCPTCHRKSVDFSGRNICPVCRARGARPIRLS